MSEYQSEFNEHLHLLVKLDESNIDIIIMNKDITYRLYKQWKKQMISNAKRDCFVLFRNVYINYIFDLFNNLIFIKRKLCNETTNLSSFYSNLEIDDMIHFYNDLFFSVTEVYRVLFTKS